mmetsp:Transcript_11591/g.31267  ORF Transcript_11591/g.31267 Transcript_11591/m.31267 type:complete len:235 (+) Transcript_11591:315-1019(+)
MCALTHALAAASASAATTAAAAACACAARPREDTWLLLSARVTPLDEPDSDVRRLIPECTRAPSCTGGESARGGACEFWGPGRGASRSCLASSATALSMRRAVISSSAEVSSDSLRTNSSYCANPLVRRRDSMRAFPAGLGPRPSRAPSCGLSAPPPSAVLASPPLSVVAVPHPLWTPAGPRACASTASSAAPVAAAVAVEPPAPPPADGAVCLAAARAASREKAPRLMAASCA